MTGVVRTLQVNAERMRAALDAGFTQATDLAEYIVQTLRRRLPHAPTTSSATPCGRRSAAGLRGVDLTGAMLDEAARRVHRATRSG